LQKLDRVIGEALKLARLIREPAVVVETQPDNGQAGEAGSTHLRREQGQRARRGGVRASQRRGRHRRWRAHAAGFADPFLPRLLTRPAIEPPSRSPKMRRPGREPSYGAIERHNHSFPESEEAAP
jgi:hypothetical protein